ncbi:MAG TPA: hypothetical protein VF120_00190 [Ktedonobacterales bacterium]
MLSERLKAVVESAAQLPAEMQEKLAAQLEAAIANAQWDIDLNDPDNDKWLEEWIAEARRDEVVEFPRTRDDNRSDEGKGPSEGTA